MKFEKAFVSRLDRYSLGVETESGLYYLAIPVSNQMIDYMEYYKLSDEEYEALRGDLDQARDFADSCRRHEHDERLFMQPGTDRGVPR
ncbi:hypothetical protein [Mycolicibacterium doricum]|uniref:Uncharacterized protein n=2 Tax=Mycolicibacterium doricum TaxID=126673 RepID=A0A1X1T044_9MYCO|nr:hypothetical protein [Mycolicibacterium doricum]MCV7266618.1 hypothetical protein [Mycolicibacterium doricum]ORV37560.1 hypothetical protein AWC01_15775 [Mycolicibacterium doricum]